MIASAVSVASAAGLGCLAVGLGCLVAVLGCFAAWLGCFAVGLGCFLQSRLASGRAVGLLAADWVGLW